MNEPAGILGDNQFHFPGNPKKYSEIATENITQLLIVKIIIILY